MWFGWFDPMYLMFLAPAMLLSAWAQWRIHRAYQDASQVPALSGYSGAQAAAELLHTAGVSRVDIEPVEGFLSDHYDPSSKTLRLSPDVFAGRSLAALGIAAHEAGHAMQDAHGYPLLVIRNAIVPLASVGGNVSMILIVLGAALASLNLILAGIIAFSATVVFQLVNLPVEFDASRRARIALVDSGLITAEEDRTVAQVLNAAATLTSVLTLLYFLFRFGVLGGRDDRE